jgi:hypothetical protein
MKMIKCKIYIDNKGREKLLVLKLDYLLKHFELSKCIRECFVSPSNVHVKKEKIYGSISKILCSFACKRRKGKNKEVLFVVCSLW